MSIKYHFTDITDCHSQSLFSSYCYDFVNIRIRTIKRNQMSTPGAFTTRIVSGYGGRAHQWGMPWFPWGHGAPYWRTWLLNHLSTDRKQWLAIVKQCHCTSVKCYKLDSADNMFQLLFLAHKEANVCVSIATRRQCNTMNISHNEHAANSALQAWRTAYITECTEP